MMRNDDIGSLLHKVSVALDKNSDQVLQERLGIGLAQFRVLLLLLEDDGSKQSVIAKSLSQTQPSISRQVSILQKKGQVIVRRNASSRRERLVFLSQKGAATAEKAVSILNDYHLPMFDRVGGKQQQELTSTLQTIMQYLEE